MLRSRQIREGSLGLFIILGVVLFGGIALWLRGINFGKGSYDIIAEFTNVGGVQLGASVSYRGFEIGRVKQIKPFANGVEVILEISPDDMRIPTGVKIQTNRYGLIGEASIDIIPDPQKPLLANAQAMSPISSDCDSNLIICAGDRLQRRSW